MVRLAHQMAYLNDNIRGDIERYHVHGVPLTVVNGRPAFEGALPTETAVMEILRAGDPDAYERVDAKRREARGERRATEAAPAGEYDVIVVRAGPAGLAAAVYATRKGRRIALIGREAGGQLNDTALIENYLGFAQIGGRELAQVMRNHVEAYPVAERCHTTVREVRARSAISRSLAASGASPAFHNVAASIRRTCSATALCSSPTAAVSIRRGSRGRRPRPCAPADCP